MPTYKLGNMFNELSDLTKNDCVLVSTNSYIRNDGNLVMGRGAAKGITEYHPNAPSQFGELIRLGVNHLGKYGILICECERYSIGAFQVKYHFKDKASLPLIAFSIKVLNTCALYYSRVLLNYPGISNGKLTKDEVEPLLRFLPRNVEIWELNYDVYGY